MILDKYKYNGFVKLTLKTRSGNVVDLGIHNSGTQRLFYGLCLSLCRRDPKNYVPAYISFAIKNGNTYTSLQNTLSRVTGTIDGTILSEEYAPSAVFKGLISAYQVGGSLSGENIKLVLLSSGATSNFSDNVLAEIPIDADTIDLSAGMVLSVAWSISFENEPEQTNQEETRGE